MDPEQLSVSVKYKSKDDKKLARECNEINNFSSYASTALVNKINSMGVLYNEEEQIRYLNRKDNAELNNLSENASSADQLIKSFGLREDDVAYLSLTYSPTDGVMIAMKNKQRQTLNRDIYINRFTYNE